MHKGTALQGLAAVSLALAAATATADDFRGFYAGAGVGSASVDSDFLGVDDSDTGFKVFGGYSLGELLAIEVAYMDSGTAEQSDSVLFFRRTGDITAVNLQSEVETEIINVSVVGNLALTETFSLFGKFGYASIDTEFTQQVLSDDPTLQFAPFRSSDRTEEVSYAAGAWYNIGPNFQLRAEYEGFDVGSGNRLDFISLSGVFRFR